MMKCKNGCLHGDTMVLMADGSERAICGVRIGDRVMNVKGGVSTITNSWRGFDNHMMEIRTNDGNQICLTEDHPVFSEKRGWMGAANIKVGDSILTKKGYVDVIDVEKAEDTDVYNLSLDDSEDGFWGNQIAVGDFDKQQELF